MRCFDRASAHAQHIMQAGAPRNLGAGNLNGLPIVVKDLTAVEGMRWTDGSRVYADRVAARSDFAIETLEANGESDQEMLTSGRYRSIYKVQ